VLATVSGKVNIFRDELEDAHGIEIAGDAFTVRYRPLMSIHVTNGTKVQEGNLIGHVAEPSINSNLQYSSTSEQQSHLHLEAEIGDARQIPTEVTIDGKRYANHLYLSKIRRMILPFHL
jgi:murein DD-endopeptidase MepM/ murein hydrolase activator NlpD